MKHKPSPFDPDGGLTVEAQWPEDKQVRPPSRKGPRPKSSYRRNLPVVDEAFKSADAVLRDNLVYCLEELCQLRPANPIKTLGLLLFEKSGIRPEEIPGSDEQIRELAAARIQNLGRTKRAKRRVAARRYDKKHQEEGYPDYNESEQEAVARIQRQHRGHTSRKRVARIKKEKDRLENPYDYEDEHEKAATTLQSHQRAKQGRKRVQGIREERKAG